MIVLAGPASPSLSREVAVLLDVECVEIEWKIFPDGESYIRCPIEVEGESVTLIQTMFPNQDKRLIELFLMLDLLQDLKAGEVTLVIPYLAYMRQDKRFMDGEAISIKTISKVIEGLNVDKVILIDVHSPLVLRYFKTEVSHISAMPLIGRYLKKLDLKDPFILAPDRKAFALAKIVADALNAPCNYLEKKRDLITGTVKTEFKQLDVADRDVVIIDDIISTGGTVANAAKIVRHLGARSILAACTHALMIANAFEKLRNSGVSEVIGTNTIENQFSKVSVAPAIVKVIKSA